MTKVYLITGDDHLDDPAWGISPIFEGSDDEVRSWLRGQSDLSVLSIVTPAQCLWAGEWLAQPLANDH